MSKTITGYVCGVDWQHELGETEISVYSSVKELKDSGKCWRQCGIVKLKIELDKWEHPQDFNVVIKDEDGK